MLSGRKEPGPGAEDEGRGKSSMGCDRRDTHPDGGGGDGTLSGVSFLISIITL